MTPLARHVSAGIALAITGAAFRTPFTPIRELAPGPYGRAR